MISKNTPILIGSGQIVIRNIESPEQVLSPVELASYAVKLAIENSGVAGLANQIDTLAVVRLFMDSAARFKHPFGSCNNLPLSVARRVGVNPGRLIYGDVGGQSPQRFVNEMTEAIYAGESKVALICGAEATAAMKLALRNQWALDWSERLSDQFEDRGIKRMQTDLERAHYFTVAPQVYALLENA